MTTDRNQRIRVAWRSAVIVVVALADLALLGAIGYWLYHDLYLPVAAGANVAIGIGWGGISLLATFWVWIMTNRLLRGLITGALVVALSVGLVLPLPAHAQFGASIVHDPIQTVQATATALRSYVSNQNEVIQIANEMKSLANDATNLLKLPMDIIQEVTDSVSQYNQLLAQAKGAVFSVQSSIDQFEAIYNNKGMSLIDKAVATVNQIKQASYTASQSQAIFDMLCANQSRITRVMAASAGAVGQLQAQQATVQMLGAIAEQQAMMTENIATMGRLHTAYYMHQAVGEDAARANAAQYLQVGPPPDWANRPSRGKALPD